MSSTLTQPSELSFLATDVGLLLGSAPHVEPVVADPGAPFSALYVFGDSLSDTGNDSLATRGLVPVSPPYAEGSFSNGPVWAQDLAQALGLPQLQPSLAGGTDFAYGGADTGQTPVHTVNPIDLPSQLAQFVAQVGTPQPNALYAVWIGSNDVLDIANNTTLTSAQQQAAVTAAVDNEVTVINDLVAHGAQNLVVLNVPDLGETPDETARGSVVAHTASSLAAAYDTQLASALQQLQGSPDLNLTQVDVYSILDQVAADPSAFGFTDVTDPLWSGNLTDANSGSLRATGAAQSQYLFFDSLHPSAQAHALLGTGIAKALTGPVATVADVQQVFEGAIRVSPPDSYAQSLANLINYGAFPLYGGIDGDRNSLEGQLLTDPNGYGGLDNTGHVSLTADNVSIPALTLALNMFQGPTNATGFNLSAAGLTFLSNYNAQTLVPDGFSLQNIYVNEGAAWFVGGSIANYDTLHNDTRDEALSAMYTQVFGKAPGVDQLPAWDGAVMDYYKAATGSEDGARGAMFGIFQSVADQGSAGTGGMHGALYQAALTALDNAAHGSGDYASLT